MPGQPELHETLYQRGNPNISGSTPDLPRTTGLCKERPCALCPGQIDSNFTPGLKQGQDLWGERNRKSP